MTVIGTALARAGIDASVVATRDLSGGCIHRVVELTLDDGTTLVAKTNDAAVLPAFDAEARCLDALGASGAVLVPRALATVADERECVLVMTTLRRATPAEASWRRLGADLASLHRVEPPALRYGFDEDNWLGATPQPNGWCDDWVEFNTRHRLGHQMRLAEAGGGLTPGELARLERVIGRLDRLIPRSPRAALLHGDLWSGNTLPARDAGGVTRVAIIDPACSYGDGWADVAMMRLFGGIPEASFDEYATRIDDHDEIPTRIAVYQLYHVLNHVNLFGRGYAGQAIELVDRLS